MKDEIPESAVKRGPIPESAVKRGLYRLLSEVFLVLASDVRIGILHTLLHHSGRPEATFTELMFDMRVNPSVLNRHLSKLLEYGMIEKTRDVKYRITDVGQLALSADPASIIELVEAALEKAKTKGLVV